MILGMIIELAAGTLCIVMGLLVWKKQKVSLIHDYHFENVKQEDLPAYTRLIGIGLIITGLGICVTGILELFDSPLWWIPMLIGFIIGLMVLNRAQKKYNGTWFS